MEGAHRGGRRVKGGVVGSKSEASARQKRAQCGAAASGRRGQAVQIARAKVAEASSEDKAVEEEVARAMQQGNGLVQATLEHLETAERSWDRFVELGGEVIDGYPSERGVRRKGVQKNAVRNYVAEMANNLWQTKYPGFGELSVAARREYWSTIFRAYKAMYASASAPAATMEDEERAEQLVAQTEEVYKRQHVYRTEIFQLQDLFIGEQESIESVHEDLITHSALAIMQSSAARIGMMAKTRHDERTVRWKKENPLRVRDVVHKVRKLVLTKATGVCAGEATSQMQLNWRRVKKEYFSCTGAMEIEQSYGARLSFRADPIYHVENFKIIDIESGQEQR
ncbi:hypothetical protein EMIHUDRAFT_98068 [Emiliania huxleyi CCMP1516]|uniref:Myb/SANT-like domain-containing protein n=2 Tax=Emiliania huxleyi TaxID=2903 RepID=A0A0D3KR13_EMIH1|nr:hypothetical protein EMIHUDRAFT_98068 [Emiliania huxleyi CCMP1516]EOD38198.1 hypothetical protein EMIHUDRAFT_98068 [Emiliania huxleyi CCMP1516]|eukprot:XP_005790627.1 hypothetical protein EMIHUDRAFT_98068 [Emiliania huxleyi CCMP1516]